jgi:3-oxoacyl-[acyl-carrier protein] reductase
MAKKIIITGASTGIGAETSRMLAPGNEIIIHYYSSKGPAEAVAADVEKAGGTAHLIQADLSKPDECERFVAECAKIFPVADVLVNNAGGLIRRQPITELDWDFMIETFALNTFSTMKVTSLCVPLLEKAEDPVIINMTSIAMRHGAPSATLYGASKGALDTFTRGAATELAPKKIRVNAVAPGVIETPFHEKVSTPEKMKTFRENTPLKRNGQARHIAQAVKYLVENDFMTGATVDVNGGLFMY